METKFTKGEWFISETEHDKPAVINIVVENGFICQLPSNRQSVHKECREEAMATAKLICAAPELLKALYDLLELADAGYAIHRDNNVESKYLQEYRTQLMNARNAIEKAIL